MSAATRHLLAAEKALDRVKRSMELAESRGVDLSHAWHGLEGLSLVLQGERFVHEELDDAAREG